MSITQFKNTATLLLDESSPVAVPLGEPVAIASTTSVERDDGVETGVWECTPGRWRRQICLLYTSPSPRDRQKSRMPSSA